MTAAPLRLRPKTGRWRQVVVEEVRSAPGQYVDLGEVVLTVRDEESVPVHATSGGRVSAVMVQSGDHVRPGATLLRIEPDTTAPPTSHVKASPRARRLAGAAGLDLSTLRPGGDRRLVGTDVEAAISERASPAWRRLPARLDLSEVWDFAARVNHGRDVPIPVSCFLLKACAHALTTAAPHLPDAVRVESVGGPGAAGILFEDAGSLSLRACALALRGDYPVRVGTGDLEAGLTLVDPWSPASRTGGGPPGRDGSPIVLDLEPPEPRKTDEDDPLSSPRPVASCVLSLDPARVEETLAPVLLDALQRALRAPELHLL